MHTAQSKYKNPDKYIKVLINQTKFAEQSARHYRKYYESEREKFKKQVECQFWFHYKTGITQGVMLNDKDDAQQARIGQRVKLMATIIELKHCKSNGSYEATMEIDDVFLLPI